MRRRLLFKQWERRRKVVCYSRLRRDCLLILEASVTGRGDASIFRRHFDYRSVWSR